MIQSHRVPSSGPIDFSGSSIIVGFLILVFIVLFFWSRWDSEKEKLYQLSSKMSLK